MPFPNAKSWRSEPENIVSGLLNVIGATLGGDLAMWIQLDRETGAAKLVEIADPNPSAQAMVEKIRSSKSFPAGLLNPKNYHGSKAHVSQFSGVPIFDESMPGLWSEFFARFPIHEVVSVPTLLDDGSTRVLITVRRTTTKYVADEIRYVESGALRLAGGSANDSVVDTIGTLRNTMTKIWEYRPQILRLREIIFGAVPPVSITFVLNLLTDPNKLRPGSLLLLGCVFAAIFGGLRSAIISSVTSAAAMWWVFTPVENSWSFATRSDALGVGVFVVTLTGVIVLLLRLDAVRTRESLERQFGDSLLDDSPIAMAVIDTDLRFRRVNQPMAELNGRSASDHVGMSLSDLNPVAGQMYEHLLIQVRDSGVPVLDHRVSISWPYREFEREWKFNLRPLFDLDSEIAGIGVTIIDITEEIETRRHSEKLFHLAETMATSIDELQIGLAICSFLTDVFHGRAAVAFRHSGGLKVNAVSGFEDDVLKSIQSGTETLELAPLRDAVNMNKLIVRSDCLALPLRRGESGEATGAMYIGWPTSRRLTESVSILLRTVSSLATHAMARIEASELAHRDEFRQSLEAMLDDVVIARSVRFEGGEISDFRIEFVNSSSFDGSRRDARSIVGQTVCDIYPKWRNSGMFVRLRDVVESGIPYQVHRMPFSDFLDLDDSAERFMSLQVAKLGDGYIAASRDVSNLVAADRAELALALQNETERSAIQLLQSAALPRSLPTWSNIRIAAVYEPSNPLQPVGGDWYDAFALDDDRLALVIADVAGHGRDAAVFMVQVRNVFRALAAEHLEPGEVMIRANNVTTELNEATGPFVTCCYAVLNLKDKTLKWAQAGHFSPLILHSDGRSTYLTECTGPPLALASAMHYESSSANLNPGDRIMMFTDGLVERKRESLDVGLTRLAQAAKDHSLLQPQEFVKVLAAKVTDRFDDLALMCVELD